MAASGGVETTDVVIAAIAGGSVVITSGVHFPSTATSTSSDFVIALSSDAASVFSTFGSTYGSINVTDISVSQTTQVPPDVTPPVITLQGEAHVEVRQRDEYTDAGALVYDNVDGYNAKLAVEGLEDVDTCCVAEFQIIYRASDQAGNVASEVVRHVSVVPLCDEPSFECGEEGEGACATCQAVVEQNGTTTTSCECIDVSYIASATTESTATVEEFDPPADTTSPRLTLLGDAELAVTTAGTQVMLHYLLQGEPWVDPGVHAWDENDGDLSNKATRYGNQAVDTSVATPPDEPYVIVYQVRDAAGNSAEEVRRRVHVSNPCSAAGEDGGAERVCDVLEDGNVTCSVNNGQLCTSLTLEDEDEAADAEPPVLTLQGPAMISVPRGQAYAACPADPPLDLVCDRGAEASDVLDGELSALVLACSPDNVVNRFVKKGLTGCGIDPDIPGKYVVVFTVTNSAGLSATVTRNVTVLATCPTGEELCSDGVTCSEEGVCLGTLGESEAKAEPEATDTPPNVTLRTFSAVDSAYVEVKQHDTYEKCAQGEEDRAEVLCEPGASAADAEDGDLAARLLACPPASCLSYGCPGHEWATKGLLGCINTTAEVGTVFEINFVVFDSMVPAQNDSATRFVTITQPCASGEELCSDMTCSPVSCAERDAVFSSSVDDTIRPTVELLHADPVRVIYGNATTALIAQPCRSLLEGSEGPPYSCLATASDDVSGDVSSSISATQDVDCDDCSSAGCPLQEVHQCFPGTYSYILRASDGSNNHGYARQQVKVVEAAAVSTKLNVSTGTSDFAAAEAQAAALLEEGSGEAAAFKQGIANLLNTASTAPGELVLPADVAITEVLVKAFPRHNNASTNTSLTSLNVPSNATATGDVFIMEVHFTVDVGVASFDASDRRRLLLSRSEGQQDPGGAAAPSRRHFLNTAESGNQLEMRSDDVAAVLVASTRDGSMSASLATAAEANNASLATEVADSSELPSTTRLTSPVDEEAAYATSISQTVESLRRGTAQMSENLRTVQETVALAGGDPDQWEARIADLWEEAQEGESANIDELSAGVKGLEEKVNRSITEYAVIIEDSNELKAERFTAYAQSLDDRLEIALQALNDSRLEEEEENGEEEEVCGIFSEPEEVQYSFTVAAPSSDQADAPQRRQLLRVSSGGSKEARFDQIVVAHPGKRIGNDFRKFADEKLPTNRHSTLLESKPDHEVPRYVLGKHRLAAGMLVYIVRNTLAEEPHRQCSQRFAHLRGQCHPQSPPHSYGRDPVFLPASQLFRPHDQNDVGKFYNNTDQPIPFVPRPLPGNPEGHPFFIDAGLGSLRAKELYTFLEDAQAMDDDALKVTVKFATWNPNQGTWIYVQLTWHREKGDWETVYTIRSATLSMTDGVEDVELVIRISVHILWVIFTFLHFHKHLGPCVAAAASPFPDQSEPAYTWLEHLAKRQPNFSALSAYLFEPFVLFDLFASAVQVATLALFVCYLLYMNFFLTMESHYDIYDNLYADANYFLSYRSESLGQTEAATLGEEEIPRWALPEDNSGLERYVQDLSTVEQLTELVRLLFNMHCFGVIVLFMHIGIASYGQRRIGILMRSIRMSFIKFMDLLLPFITIVSSFAVLYQIEYGYKSPLVNTFEAALDTLMKLALLGDFHELEVEGWVLPLNIMLLHWFYESFYIFIFNFCISNFLFAQISDVLAFNMQQANDANTVMQDLRIFYRNRVGVKILRKWPKMERIVALLEIGREHHRMQAVRTLKRAATIEEQAANDDASPVHFVQRQLGSFHKSMTNSELTTTRNAKTALHDGQRVCGCNSNELAELLAGAMVLQRHKRKSRKMMKLLKDGTEASNHERPSTMAIMLSVVPDASELKHTSLQQQIADSTPVTELLDHLEADQRFLTSWVADAITASANPLQQIAMEKGDNPLRWMPRHRKGRSPQQMRRQHLADCIAGLQQSLVARRAQQLEKTNRFLCVLHKAERQGHHSSPISCIGPDDINLDTMEPSNIAAASVALVADGEEEEGNAKTPRTFASLLNDSELQKGSH
ncbi:hypothetical protein CYMTET_39709 [Cymbomonas tetramitiformis]|uniref:Pesticidal crystal protein Cry22Aa Ig-like domain-containing protein n=1 Tax=Cymbomonas tetramitiformis TaxID=36881 RepID=A0AAE0CAL8_9CHLO|nr:hypothetical protein CYMTET_39709 [Cymbomonas tetramitiformis]